MNIDRIWIALDWFHRHVVRAEMEKAIANGWNVYEMSGVLADMSLEQEPHNAQLRAELSSPDFCDWLAEYFNAPKVLAKPPVARQRKRSAALTPQQVEEILKLVNQGVSQTEIAQRYNRHYTSINKLVNHGSTSGRKKGTEL